MAESSGSGLTFSEDDYKNARRIVGLLNKATYTVTSAEILEAAQAFIWFSKHVKDVEANIMELKRVIKSKAKAE